jgi:hypothetical protein
MAPSARERAPPGGGTDQPTKPANETNQTTMTATATTDSPDDSREYIDRGGDVYDLAASEIRQKMESAWEEYRDAVSKCIHWDVAMEPETGFDPMGAIGEVFEHVLEVQAKVAAPVTSPEDAMIHRIDAAEELLKEQLLDAILCIGVGEIRTFPDFSLEAMFERIRQCVAEEERDAGVRLSETA